MIYQTCRVALATSHPPGSLKRCSQKNSRALFQGRDLVSELAVFMGDFAEQFFSLFLLVEEQGNELDPLCHCERLLFEKFCINNDW